MSRIFYISLNSTCRDFLYKWTSNHNNRGEKNIDKGVIFWKERKHKEKPKPILSRKETVAPPPSHLFKNEASTPLILKRKQRSLSGHTLSPSALINTNLFPSLESAPFLVYLLLSLSATRQPPHTPFSCHSPISLSTDLPLPSAKFSFPVSLKKQPIAAHQHKLSDSLSTTHLQQHTALSISILKTETHLPSITRTTRKPKPRPLILSFWLLPITPRFSPHGPTTSLKISQNREPQAASGALLHIPNRQFFSESCTRTQPSPASTVASSSAPAAIADSQPTAAEGIFTSAIVCSSSNILLFPAEVALVVVTPKGHHWDNHLSAIKPVSTGNSEEGRPSWAAPDRLPPLLLQPLPRQVSRLSSLSVFLSKGFGTMQR